MPPTVSVHIRCHRDANRVHRLAKLVAPYVDEVLIAFEAGMPADEISVLAAARPHRLIALDPVKPMEGAEAFLHRRCRGTWTLRLDFDEVPSLALLRSLRHLISATDVDCLRVPRLWTWPELGQFLAQRPWWPDHQPRLLRSAARVGFPASLHEMVQFDGPQRTLVLPIYHLDLALTSASARAAKAADYARMRAMPDILGKPFNQAYYLPESYETAPETLPVPDEDASAIRDVAAGSDPAGVRLPRRIQRARRADIDAALHRTEPRWPRRGWRGLGRPGPTAPVPPYVQQGTEPAQYRARMTIVELDRRFAALEGRVLHVAVTNLGDWTWDWPGGRGTQVLASYRWRTADGRVLVADGLRTPLAGPVPPGVSTVVPVSVAAGQAGRYILELDLLVEDIRWFGLDVRLPLVIGDDQAAPVNGPIGGAL